jgi:hypothetical protein
MKLAKQANTARKCLKGVEGPLPFGSLLREEGGAQVLKVSGEISPSYRERGAFSASNIQNRV